MITGLRTAPPAFPVRLRGPLAVVGVLSAVVALALGVASTGGTGPSGIDRWLQPNQDPFGPLDITLLIDFLAEPVGAVVVVAALCGGLLLAGRTRAALLGLVGPGAAVVVVTTLVKPLVGRTIHGPENLSYPSGHTAQATAVALVLTMALTHRVWVVLMTTTAAATAMGWAEVGLSAHYPTDALGGFCVALAVVPAAGWAVDQLMRDHD